MKEELKDIPKLPETATKLLTFEGFHGLFCEFLPEACTNEQAFERTAEEYERLFGVPCRYSSYRSFREMIRRRRKAT